MKINIDGDIFNIEDGLVHSDKCPAIEFANGVEWWMHKGKLHRENGPAICKKRASKGNFYIEYWLNGEVANSDEIKNIKRNKWIDRSYEN